MLKRIFLSGIFASTIIISPFAANANQENIDNENYKEELIDLSNDKAKLNKKIKDNYEDLSEEAKNNDEYKEFIKVRDFDFSNKSEVVSRIYDLDMSKNLKFFLLSNYLDKLEIYSNNWKSKVRKKRAQLPINQIISKNIAPSSSSNSYSTTSAPKSYLKINDKEGNIFYLKNEKFGKKRN